MPTAACYVRVSTAGQAERDTPALQRVAIKGWLEKHPEYEPEWFEDLGVSGVSMPTSARPAGRKLLAAAEAGQLDAVVVYRLDRLGRDVIDALTVRRQLVDDLDIPIFSVTEGDHVDELLHGIQALIGGHEAKKRSQVQRDGSRKLAKEGAYLGGVVAFGFRVIPGDNPERRAGKLAVDETPLGAGLPSAAEVVRRIFRMAAEEGMSSVKIADRLNTLGIPTRYQLMGRDFKRGERKTRVSGRWTSGSVRRILRSRAYLGEFAYGRRNTKAPPGRRRASAPRPEIVTAHLPALALVEERAWTAAQSTLEHHRWRHDRNPKTKDGRPPEKYLLRGLMKCAECGRTFVGSAATPDKGGRTYRCNGRSKQHSSTGELCQSAVIDYPVEDMVWADIVAFFHQPEQLEKALVRSLRTEATDAQASAKELKAAQQRVAALETRRTRTLDLYADGHIDRAELAQRQAKLDEDRTALQRELARLQDGAKAAVADAAAVRAAVAKVKRLLAAKRMPFETKREVIEFLVRRATVYTVPWAAEVRRGSRWMARRHYAEVEVEFAFGLTAPYRPHPNAEIRPPKGAATPAAGRAPITPAYAAQLLRDAGLGTADDRRLGPADGQKVAGAAGSLAKTKARTARGSSRPRG